MGLVFEDNGQPRCGQFSTNMTQLTGQRYDITHENPVQALFSDIHNPAYGLFPIFNEITSFIQGMLCSSTSKESIFPTLKKGNIIIIHFYCI